MEIQSFEKIENRKHLIQPHATTSRDPRFLVAFHCFFMVSWFQSCVSLAVHSESDPVSRSYPLMLRLRYTISHESSHAPSGGFCKARSEGFAFQHSWASESASGSGLRKLQPYRQDFL